VKTLLGVDPEDHDEDTLIAMFVDAVNAVVRDMPVVDQADTDPAPEDWTGDGLAGVVLGANMLAARVYRRKDSAEGVATMAAGAPAYVMRNDPDIAQMLKLGDYSKPGVA
jgi:hypothetical protein